MSTNSSSKQQQKSASESYRLDVYKLSHETYVEELNTLLDKYSHIVHLKEHPGTKHKIIEILGKRER